MTDTCLFCALLVRWQLAEQSSYLSLCMWVSVSYFLFIIFISVSLSLNVGQGQKETEWQQDSDHQQCHHVWESYCLLLLYPIDTIWFRDSEHPYPLPAVDRNTFVGVHGHAIGDTFSLLCIVLLMWFNCVWLHVTSYRPARKMPLSRYLDWALYECAVSLQIAFQ